MTDYYRSLFTGQEREARKLLLKHKGVNAEEQAIMTCEKVDQKINDYFNVFPVGEKQEDWMLIHKKNMKNFVIL